MTAATASESTTDITPRFIGRVLLKAALLFVLFNLVFAAVNPLPWIGRLSLYNWVYPGRQRLPFGESPDSYNLSLFNLEAMFASHEVVRAKAEDEFRVIIIGDSSVWGTLLRPDETLTGQINRGGYRTSDGRQVRAYNLGYPTSSVTKDLLILTYAMQYDPDLIIWPVTLESLPDLVQLASPLVQHNPEPVRELTAAYALDVDAQDEAFVDPSFWERTIVGQRRALADVIRLNVYGVMWASTGIDQVYPDNRDNSLDDFERSEDFHGLARPLNPTDLAFEVLDAGVQMAGDVPVVVVNEPIYISQGPNSDLRYNFYYPRWAYDDYRVLIAQYTMERSLPYLDLWDLIPATQFTNSAFHITPDAEEVLAHTIVRWLGWTQE